MAMEIWRCTDQELTDALAALRVEGMHSDDPDRSLPHGWLLGALLALVEAQIKVAVPHEQEHDVVAGYRAMLDTVAGGDTPDARRAFALLLQQRIMRTAHELRHEADGHSDILLDVAGPAAVAAGNVLNLLHHGAPAPGVVVDSVKAAEVSLATATHKLDALREELRRDGFDV